MRDGVARVWTYPRDAGIIPFTAPDIWSSVFVYPAALQCGGSRNCSGNARPNLQNYWHPVLGVVALPIPIDDFPWKSLAAGTFPDVILDGFVEYAYGANDAAC